MTRGDVLNLAEKLFDVRIDSAMPQDFFDRVQAYLPPGDNPQQHYAGWGYRDGSCCGFPVPMTVAGWEALPHVLPGLAG